MMIKFVITTVLSLAVIIINAWNCFAPLSWETLSSRIEMLMAFCVINLNTPFITRSLINFFVEYPDQKRTLPVLKTMPKWRGMTTPALLQCILC